MNLPQTRDPAPARRGRRERRRKPLLRVVAIGVTTAVSGAALVPVLDAPDAVAHSHTELCSELVSQSEEYIYEEFPEEGSPPVEGEAEDYTYDAELDVPGLVTRTRTDVRGRSSSAVSNPSGAGVRPGRTPS